MLREVVKEPIEPLPNTVVILNSRILAVGRFEVVDVVYYREIAGVRQEKVKYRHQILLEPLHFRQGRANHVYNCPVVHTLLVCFYCVLRRVIVLVSGLLIGERHLVHFGELNKLSHHTLVERSNLIVYSFHQVVWQRVVALQFLEGANEQAQVGCVEGQDSVVVVFLQDSQPGLYQL